METAAAEIDVGKVLDRTYEITGMIGRGGMGAVWAARHLRLPGKRVAVKVLLNSAAQDREVFARFRREAEIASQLGHPNIIEVLDFNTLESGTPYLVLEFLDGEDLAKRIERGPIPLEQTQALVRQMGSALAAAHRAGVVHRDLKPGNIFLCPHDLDERVKILDFGISKIKGSQTVQTQESILLGTPQYMSPEQAAGKNAELDQRTDVFALGAIVYEMLCGQPAFSGPNLVAVVFQVVYQAPPSLRERMPALPAHVVAAVEKAMVKDPAHRYEQVADFIADLTGRPLQTLDRKAVSRPPSGSAELPFAATAASGSHAPALPTPPPPVAPPSSTASTPKPPTTSSGEVSPVQPAASSPSSGRSIALVGGALALAAVAVLATWKLTERPPPPHPALASPIDAARPLDLTMAPPDLAPATVPLAHAKPEIKPEARDTAPHHPAVRESLPPELAADLDEADHLVEAGKVDDGIHLARRTLNAHRSSRAFAIITRAYCRIGDLGNAKATLPSVSASDRAAVVKYCRARGTEL